MTFDPPQSIHRVTNPSLVTWQYQVVVFLYILAHVANQQKSNFKKSEEYTGVHTLKYYVDLWGFVDDQLHSLF